MDLHSKILDAPPSPGGPNSFNFMQFWGKFGEIICWRPVEGWRPHLGEILDPPLASGDVNDALIGYSTLPTVSLRM